MSGETAAAGLSSSYCDVRTENITFTFSVITQFQTILLMTRTYIQLCKCLFFDLHGVCQKVVAPESQAGLQTEQFVSPLECHIQS